MKESWLVTLYVEKNFEFAFSKGNLNSLNFWVEFGDET